MVCEGSLFGKMSYIQNMPTSLKLTFRDWSVCPTVVKCKDIEGFRIATTPYHWTGQKLIEIKTIIL